MKRQDAKCRKSFIFLGVLAFPFLLAAFAWAAPKPVSYSRQILPMFQKECLPCHSGVAPASGYAMTARNLLLKGGRHGAAIVPGKGAQSSLIKYMTGELQPKMPPGRALDLDTIALVRRWIDEGAKVDSLAAAAPPPAAPDHRRKAPLSSAAATQQPAPVTALAYAPDGKTLAVGGYRAVRLLDPATGAVRRTLPGPADQVQALAWSSDGKFLAVAGGVPGQSGEVLVYEMLTAKSIRALSGHTEVVYAVAWKPGAMEVATGSLDKTVAIWDARTGKRQQTLKDHADAVFGVAYSPDGKLLATASGDRSAKLFDTASWKRLAALNAHEDAVTRAAFNHNGTLLATAGADKTVRIWKVEIGKMGNPQRKLDEGDTVNACAFSPDGSLLVWGAANRVVKVFNGDGTQRRQELKEPSDWVYAVAVAGDNQTVAAGTQDGKVLFWDVRAGKLLRAITLLPGGARIGVTQGDPK